LGKPGNEGQFCDKYLEGTAIKWYLFSNLPGDWEDQAAVPAVAGVVVVPFAAGLRTIFLQEFK
jgi:hypothetical protein